METPIKEKILFTLSTQRFADWYSDDGEFGKWITGEVECKTKKEVDEARLKLLEDIQRLFGLE